MGRPVKAGPTPEFVSSHGTARSMGGQVLDMPRGPVRVADLPGLSTTMVVREDPRETRIGIIFYGTPAPDATHAEGYVVQVTAEIARSIAASLLRLADVLEPQAVH